MTRVSELDNQIIDTHQDNPLTSSLSSPQPSTNPTINPFKAKLKDPKFKLLFILSLILGILLILAIIASVMRKKPTPTIYQPRPTSTLSPTPTANQSQLSPIWQQRLQLRQAETQMNEDLLPPEIDTEIGK